MVGGGFAGLRAARVLARRGARVTLVDRNNYHLFQPLLYQVATAGLSPADIATPLRAILRRERNVSVLLAEAREVDVAARTVRLADGALGYDTLVLAAGATHAYFGHDEWAGRAPGLKGLEDALEIRRRILTAFERAERCEDETERRALLTFVVVGGGATGVELAGALAEISRQTLARDFRAIDPAQARVVLVEGGPHLVPAFPTVLGERARADLEHRGVEVLTGTMVTRIDEGEVELAEPGKAAHSFGHGADTPGPGGFVPGVLRARTVLWAAGVAASPLARSLGAPLDRSGRVMVEQDLSVPGHPEVFVAGDLACFAHPGESPLPGLAPVALQQGGVAAENAWLRLGGRPTRAFRYVDRGTMATIGRRAAVAVIGRVKLAGLAAWLAWVLLHIVMLIGFRNRILVMIEWAWAYATFQRGARLITGEWKETPR
ncbi:MAG: NAD(P)/FAD-dependent oxidoreductase [Candidatus Eisenbacteria bacterium]|nr:NAD(P)/FAD-dependent oxidoreductase [Candidatus Eisenbacteria bacterium]